ncbi:MRM2 [Candida pseudojiufengensis]|uniref:MRM2 n=1 Tax=Candida pseudojiufengensis TaxID=497109 RepID=UPI00222543AD|nr:MRM2 [Candida pseudojiufengensis]KAI5961880.1 MRM2 [Candida pseudojiufengensis]
MYKNINHVSVRHKSSNLKKHLQKVYNDPFNDKKRGEFYRSRAAFKLLEINKKCKLFNNNTKNVVDLGFAPGAWTQVAVNAFEHQNLPYKILGVDINQATPYKGCKYIQGDITKKTTHDLIEIFFEGEKLDLIMSDMMVNCTGVDHYDHIGNMELCNAAIILAFNQLKTGGNLVMKVWTGSEIKTLEDRMKILFTKLVRMKPDASRSESSEFYFIGLKKKNLNLTLQDLFKYRG